MVISFSLSVYIIALITKFVNRQFDLKEIVFGG